MVDIRPSPPSLQLSYRAPYAIDALLRFLSNRAVPGVETVDEASQQVSRSLRLPGPDGDVAGSVCLRFASQRSQIDVWASPSLIAHLNVLEALLRCWLDLDCAPEPITQHLEQALSLPHTARGTDPNVPPLPFSCVAGLRLPGCVDRFELAVRAVLGQQVTVAAARTLAQRFVQRFGEAVPSNEGQAGVLQLFPRPETVARASIASVAELGIIRQRAGALIALAQAWSELAFARREGPSCTAQAELQALPGIGPWTAQYMLMRGWSLPDQFLPDDIVLRKQLSNNGHALSEAAAAALGLRFAPYRSYAVLQLWHHAAHQAAQTAGAPSASTRSSPRARSIP